MATNDHVLTDYGFFKFSGAGVAVTYPTINFGQGQVASGAKIHLVPSANGLGYHIIKEVIA